MRKILFALAIALCVCSCATLSPENYDIAITSDVKDARAKIGNEEKPLPAFFSIAYSRDTLAITLITDSLQKQYNVPPRLRPAAYAGNAVWLLWWPLAYYIDKKSDKGYYYGNHLYLDSISPDATPKSSFAIPVKVYNDTNRGEVNFSLSIPYFNSFYLKPKMSPTINANGFWGVSGGVEYFYKDNHYIKLAGLAAMDFYLPVIGAVTVDGERESTTTISTSLTDNFVLNRFAAGYGISFAQNKWIYNNDGYSTSAPLGPGKYSHKVRATLSLGLQLNGYYRLGKTFYVGIIYNPYLFDVKPEAQLNYQHTLSVDFLWKIKL